MAQVSQVNRLGNEMRYNVPTPDCDPAKGFTAQGGRLLRWCDTCLEYHCEPVGV